VQANFPEDVVHLALVVAAVVEAAAVVEESVGFGALDGLVKRKK
jgi:hypothetical protein